MAKWHIPPLELPGNDVQVFVRTIYNYGQPVRVVHQATYQIFSSLNYQISWSYGEVIKWKDID